MPSAAKLLAGASGVPTDPNFRNVTLLLHGDGSNGAQNNTFVDSSTNNFTITRNGNTTQGSLSPYGSRWSNYFDGNGDYLSISNTSALDLPGDFTIEFWWNPSSLSGTQSLVGKWTFNQFAWLVQATSSNIILQTASGTGVTTISNAWSPSIGRWYHIAFTRSGTDVRAFVNGSQVGTTQTSSRTCSSTATFGIGANMDGPQEYSTGYISDLRVVKGTVVYTANFTPPIAPLTAISGTSLLTCQSNRFRDASTNNFAITANGNTSVSPFSPYAPTAPYSAATNGGSMYFDGTGDYLTLPGPAALALSTGDFTIEGWFNISSISGGPLLYDSRPYFTNGVYPAINIDGSSGVLGYYVSSAYRIQGTSAVPLGAWNHFALARSGTSTKLFLNGVQQGSTYTDGNDYLNGTSRPIIGGNGFTADGSVLGYLANLRVVKGTAVYTANFTPPTAPVTAITNTSLLLNGTNAAIIDSSADNDLETVGNAQISTSVKKFGTGSIYCATATDYLSGPLTQNTVFGTGDFTVEAWIYSVATTSLYTCIFTSRDGIASSANAVFFGLKPNTNQLTFFTSSEIIGTSTAVSTGVWTHVALVRNSGATAIYINGTSAGTATFTTSLTGTGLAIGNEYSASSGNGGLYIDDLRITKGVARYTANFTPPTAAFPDQ